MSKAETLRQSAIDKNKTSLEQLAEQVQTLREAKAQSVEELSAMLEPLAQALASLSSEAGKTLAEIQQATQTASEALQSRMTDATTSLLNSEIRAKQASAGLTRAASRLGWGHYGLTLLTGLLTAALVSGFWLWLNPPKVVIPMDTKKVVENLTPALIEAIKTSKEPVKPGKSK